jgi:maltooligosyltrehalose trehalohydrolase
MTRARRYPIGAELLAASETHFRVWAPRARKIDVAVSDAFHPLEQETGGYFSGPAPCGTDARYKFRIDGGETFPDPASRFQPDGPHGDSCVVDPFAFRWSDQDWPGIKLPGHVLYEFHVGTFTREGTWRAATEKLPPLQETGITLLEMMPIADFSGRFGWGYDGVDLFAPTHLYGAPDDLRAFIDCAHALGLGVILDVVYNHFGPDGNYLGKYSDHYLNREGENEWGDALNFDGPNCEPVREFFITNGRYWIEEFHFDGFRFDATQSIHDRSDDYIVGAIGRAARKAAGTRSIILIAENEPQETKLVRPQSEGGDDLDGLWNDDWHHSAIVALTGRNEAYLTDYRGRPQEFISAAKYGYLYQGQFYSWQEAPRGYPGLQIPPETFIAFIENHDQISNFALGDRVRALTSPGAYRAVTALLLLGPWTPMLFQGEEFGATNPFCYFADVGDDKLKEAIRKGRFEFLAQFPSAASAESQSLLPIPHDAGTFENSKLHWSEREKNKALVRLHRDLIKLRREDSRFSLQLRGGIDGAVLGYDCFVLRFFGAKDDDRLLIVNLGCRSELTPVSEPLLASPSGMEWELIWTSDSPHYDGPGRVDIVPDEGWLLPADAAVVFRPRTRKKPRKKPKKR